MFNSIKSFVEGVKVKLGTATDDEMIQYASDKALKAAKVGALAGLGLGTLAIIGIGSALKATVVVGTTVVIGAGLAAGVAVLKVATEASKEPVVAE